MGMQRRESNIICETENLLRSEAFLEGRVFEPSWYVDVP